MMSSRTFIQQRAVLKPTRQTRFTLEEEADMTDKNDTQHLARFLSTTGPDEYTKPQQQQQQNRTARILNRLRKQPLIKPVEPIKPKYVPLPVYRAPPSAVQQQESVASNTLLRDSGIYSEATTDWVVNDLQFPTPPLTKSSKKKQVRLRHVQVQTESSPSEDEESDKRACPHCRQAIPITTGRPRRPSCPPSLASGKVIAVADKSAPEDTKLLFEMLNQLKIQLEQEREHRIQLEKAMSNLMK